MSYNIFNFQTGITRRNVGLWLNNGLHNMLCQSRRLKWYGIVIGMEEVLWGTEYGLMMIHNNVHTIILMGRNREQS